MDDNEFEPCSDCDGTGEINGDPCPTCDGTGQIEIGGFQVIEPEE